MADLSEQDFDSCDVLSIRTTQESASFSVFVFDFKLQWLMTGGHPPVFSSSVVFFALSEFSKRHTIFQQNDFKLKMENKKISRGQTNNYDSVEFSGLELATGKYMF